MDLPKPPQEIELRNIIDKLAQFVARNGPEFEQMTKNKQRGNPKFSFLFGGEYFNYYQYKVTTEQAILKQKANRDNSGQMMVSGTGPGNAMSLASAPQWMGLPQPPQVPPTQSITLEAVVMQQNNLQEQIRQSEQNLAAQHTVLMQQQQGQIEEALRKAQQEALHISGTEARINFTELDAVLQPIIDSCTKDSISAGKGWILQHSTSPKADQVLAQYLLKKVIAPGAPFTQKLHIIYLVNDVMHHCVRKSAEDLKKALEGVVVPMFCNTAIGITEDQQNKLNKLLHLWESKNNYFDAAIVEQLKNPSRSWSEYQASLITQHAGVITPITATMKQTYEGYQAQHQAFVQHALQQIQTLEQQKQTMEQQQQVAVVVAAVPPVGGAPVVNVPEPQQLPTSLPPTHLPPVLAQQQPPPPPPPSLQNDIPPPEINFSQPPPGYPPVNFPPNLPGNGALEPPIALELPDLSKPPPGFPLPPVNPPVPEIMVDELMPSVPYFELPAGLMVPLIKLEDTEYKPLDPEKIRLPPPAPPSERLLAAVEAFYTPPGHDQRRDGIIDCEGWEKLGLYEYYRAKNAAKKKKEEDILQGIREKSRSPSPIMRAKSRSKSPPKKRYRSKSRSRSRSNSKTRSKSKSRSRSRTPTPAQYNNNTPSNNGITRNSTPVNNRRQSPPPRRQSPARRQSPVRRPSRQYKQRSRSRSRSKSRSRSRSPPNAFMPQGPQQRSPEHRSPTPPSFLGSTYSKTEAQRHLDESNKGHQMLRKMGWSGAGLGVKEQGIEQPISGGEIRDRTNMYKGVGINLNDPYENFRKSKGQAFINRMKARAEERL